MFRALDRRTGKPVWENRDNSGPVQYFFHSDPLVTPGVIVIGGDSANGGYVHGFDRSTGRTLWKVQAAGRGVAGPIAGSARGAYAATPAAVIGIDVNSGALRWSAPSVAQATRSS